MNINVANEREIRLRNHDWSRTKRVGVDLAWEMRRANKEITDLDIMWALLREAAKTSWLAYPSPPPQGFPSKSALPEGPFDVTHWQLMAAYLNGTLEEQPVMEARKPQPSAEQISRAEIILEIWHHYALKRQGDRSKFKKALYLKACGVPQRKIERESGIDRQRMSRLKAAAMTDMWNRVKRY